MAFHNTPKLSAAALVAMMYLGIAILPLEAARVRAAEVVSLQQMVNRIIATYPSVEIAALQVEQARQEFAKVKSTLGWQVYSHAGLAHELSFIDSPTDRFDVYASLQRRLESGSQVEIAGQYAYEESSTSFSPLLPNPAHRSGLDLRYRMPLARGRDNTFYKESLLSAEAGLQLEKAAQVQAVDNLVQQAIGIYFDAANAYQRLRDAQAAIDRAGRLKRYIDRNLSLGLAEDKDVLGIEAQLNGAISRRDSIELSWKALRIELNRLMGYPATTPLTLVSEDARDFSVQHRDQLLAEVYARNPTIAIQKALAELALADINLTRDQRMEQLDIVLSAGARYGSGDTAAGSYSQDELIGSARLEYRFELDQQGFDAEYYQSLLSYESASREQTRARHDLRYTLDRLIEQLQDGRASVRSHAKYVALEEKKLAEAVSRYREGRASVDELIDYENDLNVSIFAYNNQKIEVARVQANIQLLLGELWDTETIEIRPQIQPPARILP